MLVSMIELAVGPVIRFAAMLRFFAISDSFPQSVDSGEHVASVRQDSREIRSHCILDSADVSILSSCDVSNRADWSEFRIRVGIVAKSEVVPVRCSMMGMKPCHCVPSFLCVGVSAVGCGERHDERRDLLLLCRGSDDDDIRILPFAGFRSTSEWNT
jgi:hypothetical protein